MNNKHLLITLWVSLMAVSANADVVYEPLIVDSGFNRDVIAESTPVCDYAVSYLYAAGSPAHHCYYSMATTSVITAENVGKMNDEDYALTLQTGWPDDPTHDDANRIIRCVDDASGNPVFQNVIWQLAPYDRPNALCLRPDVDPDDEVAGLSNQGKGRLKFKKVGCYQKLYFLIVSPQLSCNNGNSEQRGVHAQVHYTDGSSSAIIYFPSIGLSGQDGARVCKTNIYENIYKKNTITKDKNKAYACAYEFNIDHTKLIESIEFENKKNCTGSIILAVTGMTASIAAPAEEAATVSNIDDDSFQACWEAIEEAVSYRLDVATDIDFQNILAEYNNKPIDGKYNTCKEVANLEAAQDYYWRVRSVNADGGQSASSAPRCVKTESSEGPKQTRDDDHQLKANDITPLLNTTTNLLINRTLYKDGYLNTLCLPFNLSAEEIAAGPLAGCELFAFDYAQKIGDARLDIHMTPVTSIEAGMPYLIQWAPGERLTQLLFEGVTILTDEGLSVGEGIRFVGNIATAPMTLEDHDNLFIGANNTLYWPSTDKGLKGFRAHFEVPKEGEEAVPMNTPARIVMQREVTTDRENVQRGETSTKIFRNGQIYIVREGVVYNLLGQISK